MALAAAWGNAADDWQDIVFISSTVGNETNRLCVGAPDDKRPSDIGCPSYAPSLSTAGHVSFTGNVSANRFIGDGSGLTNLSVSGDRIVSDTHAVIVHEGTGYVSLTTTGSTWGYLGAGWSYLANLFATTVSSSLVSASNVSATYVDATRNGTVSATYGYFRYISGTNIHGTFTGDGSGLTGIGQGDRIVSGTTNIIAWQDRSLTISTAGTQRMMVGENGNVGIGTSTPGAVMLDVAHSYPTIRLTDADAGSLGAVSGRVEFTDGSGNIAGVVGPQGNSTELVLRNLSGGRVVLTPGSTPVLSALNNGRVGIGLNVITPTATLQVSGSLIVSTSAQATTPSLYVGTDGRVGIGTSNPQQKLDVFNDAASSARIRIGNTEGSFDVIGDNGDLRVFASGTTPVLDLFDDASATFYGRVGIGTSAPGSSLTVVGEAQVGSSGAACVTAANAGAIRYSGGTLYYCNASNTWAALGTSTGVTGTGSATAVAYWSGASGLAYDSDGFYWDATNNRLGIGTNAPATALHISSTGYVKLYDVGAMRMYRPVSISSNVLLDLASDYLGSDVPVFTVRGDGRVGIGTAAPSHMLHVSKSDGSAIVGIDGANSQFKVTRFLTSGTTRWDVGTSNVAETGSNTGTDFYVSRFADNGAYIARALSIRRDTGAVGISKTSALATLDVAGTISASDVIQVGTSSLTCGAGIAGAIRYNAGSLEMCNGTAWSTLGGGGSASDRITSGTTSAIAYENASLTISTAGTQRMVVGENGWVGIGTSYPSAPLHISTSLGGLLLTRGSSTWNEPYISFQNGTTGATQGQVRGVGDGGMRFTNGNASVEWMRIASSGKVGIGSVITPTATLQVSGTISASNAIQVGTSSLVCSAGIPGAVRYNAGNVEYCNGSSWAALTSGTLPSAAVTTGTYSGMGTASQSISLGFRPKMVVVKAATGTYYGEVTAIDGMGPATAHLRGYVNAHTSTAANCTVAITDTGFDATGSANNSCFNASGTTYYYSAIGNATESGGGSALGDRITSGTHTVAVNTSSGYVSLSTGGTDWGYLSSANSYLPTLVAGRVSSTNVSASVVAVHGSGLNYGGSTPAAGDFALSIGAVGSAYVGVGRYAGQPAVQGMGTGTSYRLLLNPAAGNVGIGTVTPTSNLHVRGTTWTNLAIEAATNDPSLQLTSDGSSNTNDWTMRMDVSEADKLQWRYDNTAKMTVDVSGSMGIGSTAPKAKLDVVGTISASDAVQVGSSSLACSSGISGAIRYNAGNLEFCNGTSWTALAGGGPTGSGAANHVAYWSGANTLTYDNSQLYWDATNDRLGVGNANLGASLDVSTAGTGEQALAVFSGGIAGTVGSGARLYLSGGNGVSRAAYLAGVNTGGGANGHALVLGTSSNGSLPVERMRIDMSGNVGISASSPQAKLDVEGNVRLSTGTNAYTTFAAFDGGGAGIDPILDINMLGGDADKAHVIRMFRNTSTTGTVGLYVLRGDNTTSTNSFLSGNGNSYLNALAGNVGIGTTTPDTRLNVLLSGSTHSLVDTSNTVAVFQNSGGGGNARVDILSGPSNQSILQLGDSDDDDSGSIIYDNNTNTLSFRTNNVSNRLVIESSGNVGIGTATPSTTLYVNGQLAGGFGAMSTGGVLDFNDISNARPGSGYTLLRGSTAANAPNTSTSYWHPFSFEYITKLGSGNLTQFAIPYTVGAGMYLRTRSSGTWSAWYRFIIEDNSGNATVTNNLTAAAFLYSSDKRLKENIVALSGGLAKLDAITPVTFRFISDTAHAERLGVIAQEVEKVYPQAVIIGSDGYKKVDYPALVPVLIQAVKELRADNRGLQAANDNLRKDVDAYRATQRASLVDTVGLKEKVKILEAANDNLVKRLEALEARKATMK